VEGKKNGENLFNEGTNTNAPTWQKEESNRLEWG